MDLFPLTTMLINVAFRFYNFSGRYDKFLNEIVDFAPHRAIKMPRKCHKMCLLLPAFANGCLLWETLENT